MWPRLADVGPTRADNGGAERIPAQRAVAANCPVDTYSGRHAGMAAALDLIVDALYPWILFTIASASVVSVGRVT